MPHAQSHRRSSVSSVLQCPAAPSARRSQSLFANLFALPVRRALVEEGIHSLAEILAHIGAKDQILALVARQRPPDPADRLLGDLKGDRRMAGNQLRGLIGTALQRLDIRYHFVQQTECQRLGGFDQPGLENQILGPRRTDQRNQPADIGHRQAIAERPGDRKADPGRRRTDPDIATGGDPRAGAGQDHRLDRAVGVDGLADRRHLLVHRKRQRIARLWPVEGQPGDAVLDDIDQVFGRWYRGVHGTLFLFLPLLRSIETIQATAAFDFGIDTTSRRFRTSMAASTPPLRCGTFARSRPISTPDSVPISIRSLKCPIWPIRNALPLSFPRPVPSDMSKFSRITLRKASASCPSGTMTAVSAGE